MATKNLYIVIIKRSVRLLFSERVQIDLIVPRCYFGCVKMGGTCMVFQIPPFLVQILNYLHNVNVGKNKGESRILGKKE